MAQSKKSDGFIARVIAFIKGGDEAKLGKFQRLAIRHAEEQISIRESSIETLKMTREDKEEELEEATLNINLEKIQKTEDVKKYVPAYFSGIRAKQMEIEKINSEIEEHQTQIKYYQGVVSKIS